VNAAISLEPITLGLFERRIQGDDCLMELASRRFNEARMGAEIHAAGPEQLESDMNFRPWPNAPVMVHLPRDFNLADERSRTGVYEFARRFEGRVCGLVLHDHKSMVECTSAYLAAAREVNRRLSQQHTAPRLYIEYAVGLDPVEFANFFESISDLDRVGPCIDISHVGIKAARVAYARNHGGEDIRSLKSQPPRLQHVIDDVQTAVAAGCTAVFDLVKAISAGNNPVHFHLHDGHPLSTLSPFGVSDHLSFLTEIPLSFEHSGRRSVPSMFGPAGLRGLVTHVLKLLGHRQLSFTLEIHPDNQRLPLNDAVDLFNHWTDKTNAEKMNHWLSVLTVNHVLLRQALGLV
jgi:hypothetical protein